MFQKAIHHPEIFRQHFIPEDSHLTEWVWETETGKVNV